MAETAASTAYGPMVLVAIEQLFPKEQRIVDDKFAYQLLPPYMKWTVNACKLNLVRQGFFNLMEKSMPGMWNGFPCRKRYIDDKIVAALNDKNEIKSVVILGAGLDTLAYRISQLSSLQVYEVDLPENIAYKRKKLEALFGAVPAHVRLVGVNFEDQALDTALMQHGYSFNQKSIFVWEAVTQYLTESAARETFRVLAKAQPGSRLLFTYVLQDFIDGSNTYGLDSLYQRFRVKSQLWQFGIHRHKLDEFIGEYSWKVLEHIGAAEYAQRYLKPMGRPASIAEIERAVYAEKR